MDMSYAVTYIFEDRQWQNKLVPLLFFMLLSIIPILGLIPLALALGFMLQVVTNVREGLPRPLPKWQDMGDKFNLGGQLLAAIIVYNLPLILVNLCSSWVLGGVGSGFLGSLTSLVMICCLVPFSLLYTLLMWPLLAIGTVRYSETGNNRSLYRIALSYEILRDHGRLTMQWVLMATLVNVLLILLLLIPCLGWLIGPALALPVHAHLLGQYARNLRIRPAADKRPGPARA